MIVLARFPWLLRYAAWLELAIVGLGPVVFLFWHLYQVEYAGNGSLNQALLIFALIASVIGIVVFMILQVYMQTTEFGLTDRRIILKTGFISRRTNEIPLDALENVNVIQTVFERLFSYGRLEINGSGGSPLNTHPIQNPVDIRTYISEARIAIERTPAFKTPHPQDRSTQ